MTIAAGEYDLEERSIFDVELRRKRGNTIRYQAFNDAVIAKGALALARLSLIDNVDGVEEVVILPSLHDNCEWIHDAVRSLEVLPIRVSLAIPRPALDSNRVKS